MYVMKLRLDALLGFQSLLEDVHLSIDETELRYYRYILCLSYESYGCNARCQK